MLHIMLWQDLFCIFTLTKKIKVMYSLDCSYFDREFHTINELIDHIINLGMDPNYEITKNGVGIGEKAWDLVQC